MGCRFIIRILKECKLVKGHHYMQWFVTVPMPPHQSQRNFPYWPAEQASYWLSASSSRHYLYLLVSGELAQSKPAPCLSEQMDEEEKCCVAWCKDAWIVQEGSEAVCNVVAQAESTQIRKTDKWSCLHISVDVTLTSSDSEKNSASPDSND